MPGMAPRPQPGPRTGAPRGATGGSARGRRPASSPVCSQAMSAWVLGRKTGNVAPSVYATLGKCRADAHPNISKPALDAQAKVARVKAIVSQRLGQTVAKASPELVASSRAERHAKILERGGTLHVTGRSGVKGLARLHKVGDTHHLVIHDAATGKRLTSTATDAEGLRRYTSHMGESIRAVRLRGERGAPAATPKAIAPIAPKAEPPPAERARKVLDERLGRTKAGRPDRGVELHQWHRNAEGGQSAGNRQVIRPLTERAFQKHIVPHLRKGYAKTLAEYQAKVPGATHYSSTRRDGKGPHQFDRAGSPAELRPQGTAAKWAKRVESFRDSGAKAHGSTADSAAPAKAEGRPAPARQRVAERLKSVRAKADKPATPATALDPATHGDHPPGHVGHLDTSLIHADPGRFQYKGGFHSATGSVESLGGVQKFDHNLAGVVGVWKDPANGKVFVVNGHNRLDLANRLGEKRVAARFLDAKSAEEAKAQGALINIAEGRGTSTDAAKFFQSNNLTLADLKAKGIPLKEKVATEGLALSGLPRPLFDRVVNGELKPERAAIIGGSGLDHDQQMKLHALAEKRGKGREVNNETLRELADDVKAAPKASKGPNLFGDDDEESLAVHRAGLVAKVKEHLRDDKRVFGTVAKGKAAAKLTAAGNTIDAEGAKSISDAAAHRLAMFDQLKRSTLAGHLNRATERIHAGENRKKIHEEVLAHVYKHIDAAGTL